jgi:hypothetical protein
MSSRPVTRTSPSSLLLRITARHMVAGVIVDHGSVVIAADILRYMIGWTQEKVLNYCRVKNWRVEIL